MVDGNKTKNSVVPLAADTTQTSHHVSYKLPHKMKLMSAWKNLNITAMLKLSHPHSQSEISYYLYWFLSVCMAKEGFVENKPGHLLLLYQSQ